MNGDESGGPAERDEHTLVDQQPTGETWPSGGVSADEPVEGTAETTVTDDPLEPETETTAEGGFFDDSDPWPDLADVTEEEPWDPATLPQPGASSADLDRRVAPEPPAMVEMSVAMAAAAPRPRPAVPADEAGPGAPPAPADPVAPVGLAPADPALADPAAQVNSAAPVGPVPPAAPAGQVASMHEAPPPPPLAMHGPAMGTPPGGVPHPLGGTPPGGIPHPLGGTPPGGMPHPMATNALPDRRPPGSGSRLPKILIGVAAGLVVVVIGALAIVALSSSGSERSGAAAASPNGTAPATPEGSGGPSGSPGAEPTSTAPGSPTPGAGQVPVQPSGPVTAPSSGAPAGTPIAPPQPSGPAVRYQTVQQDPGYFEGVLTFTNETGEMMHAWEVSFTYPGANVKNIWDAVLVRGGDHPVIRSLRTAEAIPPGGSLEVRFGAEGVPSMPRDCLFGGQACGFA